MHSLLRTLALLAALLGAHAHAHVVLQDPLAAAGSSYRATLQVAHGCDGFATTAIQVLIPEGFRGSKPMPKPGWTLRTVVGKLTRPYDNHGKTITEDVVEVSWTANSRDNALPDAWYDEFVLRGTTPRQAGALWFKVLQSCEKGQNRWVETPASGTSTQGLQWPAALLEVVDGEAAEHSH